MAAEENSPCGDGDTLALPAELPSPYVMWAGDGSSPTASSGGAPVAVDGEEPPRFEHPRFSLLRLLGSGGMGVVHTAYDALLDRIVAIKMVRGDRSDRSMAARVMREAKALAKVSHPNVVQIYDVGTADGQVFIAMEYVQGPTLRSWVAQRRAAGASQREILDMVLRAGQGLVAAHAVGLVHRDFKPDNVLVGADGRPRVLDFGLVTTRGGRVEADGSVADEREEAESVGEPELPLTRQGTLLGTPAYMSPEQWFGHPADARSDQFSFCATVYEALYGVRPFVGDDATSYERAISGGQFQAAPPGTATVPAAIGAALQRGLAFSPEDRFADLARLLAALAEDPVAARRRRVRLAAIVVMTAVVVVGLVLGGQALWRRRLHEQREQAALEVLERASSRIAEARAAGDVATGERLFAALLEEPALRDTAAIARAWLDAAQRRSGAGAVSAYAQAVLSASDPLDDRAALLGLARLFRGRLEWGGLRQVLALIERRHAEVAGSAEVRGLRVDVALALRDMPRARALLADEPVGSEQRGLAEALGNARATPLRHIVWSYGRFGDELWLLERHQAAPVLHVVRADGSLAELWRHDFSDAHLVLSADPETPTLVTWGEHLDVHTRAPGGGLTRVYRGAATEVFAAAAADLDGDGRKELYIGTGTSGQVVRLRDDGAGTWSERVVFGREDTLESMVMSMAAADLDGDGTQELLAAVGGWRAYDLRVLRLDPGTDKLVTVAREKLGMMQSVAPLRGADGSRYVAVEILNKEQNTLVFPRDAPFGAAPGTHLLSYDGARLTRRRYLPFVGDIDDSNTHWLPLVGDFNGDGRDDLVNLSTIRDRPSSTLHLQRADGSFAPTVIDGIEVVGVAQLDEDAASELLVSTHEPERAAFWGLGVGDGQLPVLATGPPPPARAELDDPLLAGGFARADDLRGLGLFADAAAGYEELARRASASEVRDRARLDAATLRERLGQDAAALALYREVGSPELAEEATQGVYRSHLRLGEYAEAQRVLGRPTGAPATTVLEFSRPLAAPWRIVDPLSLRRLASAGVLQVAGAASGVLAELPLEWDGEAIDVAIDLEVEHTEWSSALALELVAEDGPERPVLVLDVATFGTSRGGMPPVRMYMCRAGERYMYINHTPLVVADSPDEASSVQLRAFMVAPLGELGCSLTDLAQGDTRTERDRMLAPGRAGRYRLVLRASHDVPSWLAVKVRRISVRGARLAEGPAPDPLAVALVEGDLPAARVGAEDDPRAAVWRAWVLHRLGRLTEAEPLWRAVLASEDPAVRGVLHTLMRGDTWGIGPVLRAISEPRWLVLLAETWRNTGINHLTDLRVHAGLLEVLATLDAGELAAPGADAAELLRAAELLTWRARLHVRGGREAQASEDFARALELGLRADATFRVGMIRLDLASLRVTTGDLEGARAEVRAACASGPMALLFADIVRARPELAGLAVDANAGPAPPPQL